jgi:hypothetical protein
MGEKEDMAYKEAVKVVKERRDFFQHLAVYVAVCTFLSLMTALVWSPGGHFWPLYVILGWGIGVASHAVSVFLGKDWERRKVKEYMERHKDAVDDDPDM